MMANVDKVQLVQEIEALAAAPADDERDNELAVRILKLVGSDPGPALLVLWDRLAVERDPAVARALSFAFARHAESAGVVACPVLSSLLASPVVTDPAALVNTIAVVALVDPANPVQVGVLQSDLGAFLLKCVDRPEVPVDVVIGLLLRLADLELLTRVISDSQRSTIRDRLGAAVASTSSDLVRSDWKELQAELQREFQASVRINGGAIEALSAPGLWPDVAGWGDFFSDAVRSGTAALRDILLLEELSAEATGTTTAVHQLHLTGPATHGGKLAVGAYARLLSAWRRLYETAFGALEARGEGPIGAIPAMFVLAPQPSSFVIRVTVDTGGRDDLAANAFARSVEAVQLGDVGDLDVSTRDSIVGAVDIVYSVLSASSLDLSISMEAPRARLTRAHTRVTHTIAIRSLSARRRTVELVRAPHTVIGMLEAANHRTGVVEIGLEDGATLTCEIEASRRAELLNLVIGRRYAFAIEWRSGGEQPTWSLMSIGSRDGGPPPREIELALLPPGAKLASDFIPQQDRLDRVVQVVRLIAAGRPVTPSAMGMTDTKSSVRHINYMRHAAKVLRLCTEGGDLQPSGWTLATLAEHRALPFLALQFETTAVGHAWLEWAEVLDVEGLDPASATDFLRARAVLSESMAVRRGRTLRRWVEAFQAQAHGNQPADGE